MPAIATPGEPLLEPGVLEVAQNLLPAHSTGDVDPDRFRRFGGGPVVEAGLISRSCRRALTWSRRRRRARGGVSPVVARILSISALRARSIRNPIGGCASLYGDGGFFRFRERRVPGVPFQGAG